MPEKLGGEQGAAYTMWVELNYVGLESAGIEANKTE
jgi:hypothetical protein